MCSYITTDIPQGHALSISLTHLSSHEIQLQIYDYVEVSHALESRYFHHLFGGGGIFSIVIN